MARASLSDEWNLEKEIMFCSICEGNGMCSSEQKNATVQIGELNHGIDAQGGKKTAEKRLLSLKISRPVVTFRKFKLKSIINLSAFFSNPLYIIIPSIQISSI